MENSRFCPYFHLCLCAYALIVKKMIILTSNFDATSLKTLTNIVSKKVEKKEVRGLCITCCFRLYFVYVCTRTDSCRIGIIVTSNCPANAS